MAHYIISKVGVDTKAWNTSTEAYEFTNTGSASVFNSVINELSALGGGNIYVKNGSYDISDKIDLIDNLTIVGESRDSTTLNNLSDSMQILRRTGQITTNFKLFNITLKSAGHFPHIFIHGGTRCVLKGCRFWYSSAPAASQIMVWINTNTPTTYSYYNTIVDNIFEGSTNGQDMLGGGQMDFSVISNNQFIGAAGVGQGIGSNHTRFATISYNLFQNVGNPIGMEGTAAANGGTYGNTIMGNVCYNSGKIKLALEGSTNLSGYNIVVGNFQIYGNCGIEDGNGYADLIANNIICRSTITGIRGTFDRCTIANNLMIETNNTSSTPSGNRVGGIYLQDNATTPTPTATLIRGNKIIRTGAAYTYEPDSSSKTGEPGGILVGSTYSNVIVEDNHLDNVLVSRLVDAGTATRIKNNVGWKTEAKGTASISSAATSIAVTHGLDYTPTLSDIKVTATNSMGTATKFWISTPTSTQFTINVNVAPGATTATFVWQVNKEL